MTALPRSRGEVWWCELAEIGRRPVVVLSRDAVIPRHRRALDSGHGILTGGGHEFCPLAAMRTAR